jgi:hypothetical protein
MRWLIRWWHRHQRKVDVQILWPSCRELCADLNQAKAAFAQHAYNDAAWQELGDAEIRHQIDLLK